MLNNYFIEPILREVQKAEKPERIKIMKILIDETPFGFAMGKECEKCGSLKTWYWDEWTIEEPIAYRNEVIRCYACGKYSRRVVETRLLLPKSPGSREGWGWRKTKSIP